MPLIDIKALTNGATLGLWSLTETLEELKAKYTPHADELAKFSLAKSPKRYLELYGTRVLLAKMSPKTLIDYYPQGQPHLSNGEHISISHTPGYIALLTHPSQAVGIDIQVHKKNIEKGVKLFMQPHEMQNLPSLQREGALHIYWCAKEAVYKQQSSKNLLLNDITIAAFSLQEHGELLASVGKTKKQVCVKYEIHPKYYLAFTI